MKTLAQMAGSNQTINLGGQDLVLSPIDLSDLGEIEQWVQYLPLHEARQEIEAGSGLLSEEDEKEIVQKARQKVEDFRDVREGAAESPEQISRCQEYMNRKLGTVQGIQYMLWLSLKKAHPELTREEVSRLVSEGNREAIQERIDDVSFGAVAGEAPAEKKTVHPQTTGQTPLNYCRRIGRAFLDLLRVIFIFPQSRSDG